jgi:dTDP-4-amino-4,6-dideoxygalactose transaminase
MAGLNKAITNLKISINDVNEYNNLFSNVFIENMSTILQKGNYILGEEVDIFEKTHAKYINTKYCVGVSNGTSALELAFQLLNLQPDDEVIIQANAYIACAFGALKSNAKLVLIDCDENGLFNIEEFQNKINSKTKAVLVVHLYGDSCNMDLMKQICNDKNIFMIEDCAQAQGTKYNDKMIGSFGDMSCFSFYPSKNLGALGDAGAICTNNEFYYNQLKKLRNLGSVIKYYHDIVATNSRLDTIQAMFLLTKFGDIDNTIIHKQKLANLYKNMPLLLEHIKNKDEKVSHSYHLYVVKLHDTINRDHFMEYLNEHGVQTLIHYKIPFYKSGAFSELNHLTFSNAEKLADRIVSLPIYNTMTEEKVNYVMQVINDYDIKICPF